MITFIRIKIKLLSLFSGQKLKGLRDAEAAKRAEHERGKCQDAFTLNVKRTISKPPFALSLAAAEASMREAPLRQQIGEALDTTFTDKSKLLFGFKQLSSITALAQQGVQELEAYKAQLHAQGKFLSTFLNRVSFWIQSGF